MTEIKGRTAFITGGANGIGLGIARVFAKAGANIAIVDIDDSALEAAETELAGLTSVRALKLDVRDREAYARVAAKVERELGPVSLLFNNAGVAGGAPAGKLTYEMWDWSIGINLYGVINGIQTFLPAMVERGAGGHIVNTASGAGLAASSSGTLYCTAKFGVVGMSEALKSELSIAGIGVSVLCPGPVATDIVKRSHDSRPASGMSLSDEQKQQGAARVELMTKILADGVQPDAVGEMVLKAVRENSLYIHTDRIMADFIAARTQALLDAMPVA